MRSNIVRGGGHTRPLRGRWYWLAGLVVLLLVGTVSGAVLAQSDEQCFEETGYCISGRIREFWQQNGGLPVFGFPITPQREETIEGRALQVQWFQRNRLELHPDQQRPYDVQLGRLGVDVLEQQGRNWYAFPKAGGPEQGCQYFEQTEQNICGEILIAWLVDGIDLNQDGVSGNSDAESLALFGLPISGRMTERLQVGRDEYKEVTVQYFERARFELHPDNPPPDNVLLGLLGNELLLADEGSGEGGEGGGEPAPAPAPEATPTPLPEPGSIVFVSDRDDNWEIYTMNTDGSSQTNISNNANTEGRPVWSPDGSRIAFYSLRDGNEEIYVMNADGSNPVNLTNNPAVDTFPAWSPDGSRIAFASNRDGNEEIYVMNADGSNPVNLTRSQSNTDVHPTWSPDGSRLAFASIRADNPNAEIYVMDADGSRQVNLTNAPGNDYEPAWSPDGSRIAFTSERDGNREIYVMNADGSGQTRLTVEPENDFRPAWTPDSGRIAFTSQRDGNWEVYVMHPDGQAQTNLSNHPNNDFWPDWAPATE